MWAAGVKALKNQEKSEFRIYKQKNAVYNKTVGTTSAEPEKESGRWIPEQKWKKTLLRSTIK
jgi:hypothetical protein